MRSRDEGLTLTLTLPLTLTTGPNQARFRRMGAMKVKAFHALLSMGRRVLVSDVDTVRHQT